MDQNRAIAVTRRYIDKVLLKNQNISQVWLFGSTAKGTRAEDSDIDLAFILKDNSKSFEKEVELMTLRQGDETAIEPHLFNNEDLDSGLPLVHQILTFGYLIDRK